MTLTETRLTRFEVSAKIAARCSQLLVRLAGLIVSGGYVNARFCVFHPCDILIHGHIIAEGLYPVGRCVGPGSLVTTVKHKREILCGF